MRKGFYGHRVCGNAYLTLFCGIKGQKTRSCARRDPPPLPPLATSPGVVCTYNEPTPGGSKLFK